MKNLLTFEMFREANVTRAKHFPSAEQNWTPADWLTATVGELGELANLMKKIRRGIDYTKGQSIEEMQAQLAGEYADVLTYFDLLGAKLNIPAADALIHKFNVVSTRVGAPVVIVADGSGWVHG